MSVIASAFTGGYPSNPVVSGAAAANQVLTSSSSTAAAWQLGLVLQAATPVGGYVLVNGTGTIISWTAPNDGKQHRVVIPQSMDVISGMTGGNINLNMTMPDGTASVFTAFAPTGTTGFNFSAYGPSMIVEAGTTVSLSQSSPLSVGSAKLWAEIWGS